MIPPDELELVRDRDPEAEERARRALFWTFVYHLEPKKWERLASVEPIHPEALAAIHDFLRFQITDHKTGDSPEVNDR